MLPLRHILDNKTRRSKILKAATASLVVEEANRVLGQIFGDNFLNFAKAIYLKKNILTIACLSSVSAQEVKISEQNILDEINEVFGRKVVLIIKYIA